MRIRRRNGGRCVLLSNLRACCWYSRLHHVWELLAADGTVRDCQEAAALSSEPELPVVSVRA